MYQYISDQKRLVWSRQQQFQFDFMEVDPRNSIDHLKAVHKQIEDKIDKTETERINLKLENEITIKKLQNKFQSERSNYEGLLLQRERRIGQLEERCKYLETQQNEKFRKQIRRYVDALTEKDLEISNLRKQINAQKNKLSSLQNQIAGLNTTKENYDAHILKSIDQMKANIQDMNNNFQEIQTQKIIVQSKLRQLNQKAEIYVNKALEFESKYNYIHQIYEKEKIRAKNISNQCLELKFELEKQKQIEKEKAIIFNLQSTKKIETSQDIAQQIQKIYGLAAMLKERQDMLIQVTNYHKLSEGLIEENRQLKASIQDLQTVIEQLKIKMVEGYEDQFLKSKEPSLFQFLKSKKELVNRYESQLEKIENYIQSKDEEIQKLLREAFERQKGCTCNKQEQIDRLSSQNQQLGKKYEQYRQRYEGSKQQVNQLQDLNQTYRNQLKQYAIHEIQKIKKKKPQKKRCLQCFLPIEKSDKTDHCSCCNRNYHKSCVQEHECQNIRNQMLLNSSMET